MVRGSHRGNKRGVFWGDGIALHLIMVVIIQIYTCAKIELYPKKKKRVNFTI